MIEIEAHSALTVLREAIASASVPIEPFITRLVRRTEALACDVVKVLCIRRARVLRVLSALASAFRVVPYGENSIS